MLFFFTGSCIYSRISWSMAQWWLIRSELDMLKNLGNLLLSELTRLMHTQGICSWVSIDILHRQSIDTWSTSWLILVNTQSTSQLAVCRESTNLCRHHLLINWSALINPEDWQPTLGQLFSIDPLSPVGCQSNPHLVSMEDWSRGHFSVVRDVNQGYQFTIDFGWFLI